MTKAQAKALNSGDLVVVKGILCEFKSFGGIHIILRRKGEMIWVVYENVDLPTDLVKALV